MYNQFAYYKDSSHFHHFTGDVSSLQMHCFGNVIYDTFIFYLIYVRNLWWDSTFLVKEKQINFTMLWKLESEITK